MHPGRISSARKPLVYQVLCTNPNQRDICHFYSVCDEPYQASHRCADLDNWHDPHLGLPGDPHLIKSKIPNSWRLTSGLLSKSSRFIYGGYSFQLPSSHYWSTKCRRGWSQSCSTSLSSPAHFGCCMMNGGCTCPPAQRGGAKYWNSPFWFTIRHTERTRTPWRGNLGSPCWLRTFLHKSNSNSRHWGPCRPQCSPISWDPLRQSGLWTMRWQSTCVMRDIPLWTSRIKLPRGGAHEESQCLWIVILSYEGFLWKYSTEYSKGT